MDYYKVSITSSADKQDIIIAILSQASYNGFEEGQFGFKAYIPETDYDEKLINQLANQFDFSFKAKLIPAQNWNALWEANFQPIRINDFCGIRADFHPTFKDIKHQITINPKMAFGTGHHETTMTVIETMQDLQFANKKVFDFGCGTGILAILAAKMGSDNILALDNDPLSYENTKENCQKNQVTQVTTILGEISVVNEIDFDIILANINRNVILDSLPTLFQKTKANGQVLISGLLLTDQSLISEAVEKVGFTIESVRTKGEWICMLLTK